MPWFDFSAFNDTMPGIALQSSDKENSLIIQLVILGVVGISAIKGNNRSVWQRQHAACGDIMAVAVSD